MTDNDKEVMVRMLRELTEYSDDVIRVLQNSNKPKEEQEQQQTTPTQQLRKIASLKSTGKYMVAAAKQGIVTGPDAIRYNAAGNALLAKAPKAGSATEAIKAAVPMKEYSYPSGFDDLAKSGRKYDTRYTTGDIGRSHTVDLLEQSAARNAHEQLRLKAHTGVVRNPNKAQANMASAMTADNLRRINSGRHKPKAPPQATYSDVTKGTLHEPKASTSSALRTKVLNLFRKPALA